MINANIRPRLRVNQILHVKRHLNGPGKILVKENSELKPQDIIGRSTVSAGFANLNIAKILDVSPDQGVRYLQRETGKLIYKGELLALKKNIMGNKTIVAPTDAQIEEYDRSTGELRLKFLPRETPLISGVYGIVDAIDNTSGEILIKTIVTEIFGIMGSGRERGGILNIMSEKGKLVVPSYITSNLSQHILIVGSIVFGETLRQAISVGVNGIISGGINASDFKSIAGGLDPFLRVGSDMGISILALEGFGSIPIGEDIFTILKKHNENFIFISGNGGRVLLPEASGDSIILLRKTFLPLNQAIDIPPEIQIGEIKKGIKVRIIWPPFLGLQGKVVEIDQQSTVLKSGISTYMLTVEIPNQKIKVPYPNVEILG